MSGRQLEAAAEAYVTAIADAPDVHVYDVAYAHFISQSALNGAEYHELVYRQVERQTLALEAIANALAFLAGGIEREVSGWSVRSTLNDALLKTLAPLVAETMKHE